MRYVIHRRTPKMLLLEERYDTAIDDLLLKVLRDAQGDFLMASQSIALSRSTYRQWLQHLGLDTEVTRIRRQFDRPRMERGLLSGDEAAKLRIEKAIRDACMACQASILTLPQPVVLLGLALKKAEGKLQTMLYIKDGLDRRHAYGLVEGGIEELAINKSGRKDGEVGESEGSKAFYRALEKRGRYKRKVKRDMHKQRGEL